MTDYADQNLRMAQKMLEQQGEVNRLVAELAAANAALTAVTDLLDEARTERDAALKDVREREQRIHDRNKWLSDWEDACPEDVDVETGPQALRLWAAEVVAERDKAREEADAFDKLADRSTAGWNAALRERDALRAEVMRYRAELRGMGRAIAFDAERP